MLSNSIIFPVCFVKYARNFSRSIQESRKISFFSRWMIRFSSREM